MPEEGTSEAEVEITGGNFSEDESINIVLFGNINAEIIDATGEWQILEKNRLENGWLLSAGFEAKRNTIYATADQSGNLYLDAMVATYKYKGKSIIHDLCFLPRKDKIFIRLAIATRGEGVKIINATDLKYK